MNILIEREFSEVEIAKCEAFYETIVQEHEECDGTGYFIKIKDGAIDCVCENVYKYVRELLYACIPQRFWGVEYNSYKSLLSDTDKEFFKNIKNTNSNSCVIMGDPNSGKTALLVLMGKVLIRKGKSVFYINSEDLIELAKFREKKETHTILWDRMQNADVILFDDLTSFNWNDWASSQIESTLKKFYDSGKEVIVVSALTPEEISERISTGLSNFVNKLGISILVDYDSTSKYELNPNLFLTENMIIEANDFIDKDI